MAQTPFIERIRRAKRVYLIGNGGSYANAQHIANDLLAAGVRAFTLDPATLTAISNDFGYDHCFARWLVVVAERGDLLIAFSGSGTSANIVRAIEEARRLEMDVELISWFLRDGMDMQMSEETHLVMGHAWMKALKCS